MILKLVTVLLCVTFCIAQESDPILCNARFCIDYVDSNPCPGTANQCNVQNSTYNGISLSSNDPCNCCSFCLVNLNKGDYCSHGDVGSSVPDSICGPGLTCDAVTATCVEMTGNTECTKKQFDYDTRRQKGTLGSLEVRAKCDSDGYYEPVFCIPEQNCFCVDSEGKRVFGEISYSPLAAMTMKCECSRKFDIAKSVLGMNNLNPYQFFRCDDNGNFDTIQCIGEGCMCTDAEDGAPTFPTDPLINITLVNNNSLPDCFKVGKHLEGAYHFSCGAEYVALLEEVAAYKEKSGYEEVFDVEFPTCDINGKYAPVKKLKDKAICVDFDGKQIENYEVSLLDNIENMNCYCARTRLLLKNTAEEPECCPNGNYNPVQCRRGMCYCVDENGYQNVSPEGLENETTEVNKEKLHCYSSSCQK